MTQDRFSPNKWESRNKQSPKLLQIFFIESYGLIFTSVKKLKPYGSTPSPNNIIYLFSFF